MGLTLKSAISEVFCRSLVRGVQPNFPRGRVPTSLPTITYKKNFDVLHLYLRPILDPYPLDYKGSLVIYNLGSAD